MMIGSRDLLNKYGSELAVAEALLRGKLDSYDMRFVDEVVSKVVLEAAKIRLEHAKRDTVGIKAKVQVNLRDNSSQRKTYVAEKDVVFPMDPTSIDYINLRVGNTTVQFTADDIDISWDEMKNILMVDLGDYSITNGDFHTEEGKKFLAKNSGWKVTLQK